jgi:hypothetical protein
MSKLNAFDVAFRGDLTGDLSEVFQTALDQGRVMTVSAKSPAPQLAKNADACGIEVISVVDAVQKPVGYIFPGWIAKQVTLNKKTPVATMSEAIVVLELEPKTKGKELLHEWLNLDQPEPRECPGGGGDTPHPTFFDPCLIHGK